MQSLTPESLQMIDAIARHGSFAKAARELGKVPSAVTYSVRRLEDDLDVLLFDRSGHRAQLTRAGTELLREGRHLLNAFDALAHRVKRIATGWEVELRIAVNAILCEDPLFDLVEDFHALGTGTRLRFSTEVLQGNWDALLSGRADLAIGTDADGAPAEGFHSRVIGQMPFVFCMAPHHPLASMEDPLDPAVIERHTAVAVADTSRRLPVMSKGLLSVQHTLTVSTLQAKLQAQLRGLGCGYLPEPMAAPYLSQGRLVARQVDGVPLNERVLYAWRAPAEGLALQWFLQRLESPRLRAALLTPLHAQAPAGKVLP
ncbi:LysR family transcriptional regulator [Pigmentiphaga litoralis]|uniref:Molybdate transport repressor ModE-like protein n=1 Tax=Pigmentiphaga litoralis TaxID=516702 RepID=A0A7Y9ITN1_9BURK|nr:LysR family transcriptional regulator [Pigmentiphaga litoralis]NYE23506.1 molybdate transport repressor ModE-like protein [Pigmentiphaga litoralis]NYE82880.1 molybdate transport repressor ModE-like protein [Pigmentiphaga litoralis]